MINYEKNNIDELPEKSTTLMPMKFYTGIDMNFNGYKIIAYPGPMIVNNGRTEHLPLHCHIYYSKIELKVNCETLTEMSGKKIPKDLRKYLKKNKKDISKRVERVFTTGSLA